MMVQMKTCSWKMIVLCALMCIIACVGSLHGFHSSPFLNDLLHLHCIWNIFISLWNLEATGEKKPHSKPMNKPMGQGLHNSRGPHQGPDRRHGLTHNTQTCPNMKPHPDPVCLLHIPSLLGEIWQVRQKFQG